jgi:hypothetical protein
LNAVIKFTGLNNRLRPSEFPAGQLGPDFNKCWKAVNVQFSPDVLIPCQGTSSVYEGDCSSLYVSDNGTLFVEGSKLYLLDSPPIELASGSGFYYTEVGNTIYFSNGTVKGRYVKGETAAREWGTAVPTQPSCTAITTGGMDAGDYRVAITWIADEESGTGNSVKVTVVDGGGIALSAFPAAPPYVTKVAVWLSSCNGKDLYLYDEYVIATTSVNLVKSRGVIPLETQFGYPPTPAGPMLAHYGRIYYASGPLVYYTHIGAQGPRYGLQIAHNFFVFDGNVQTMVSTPGELFIGTLTTQYKIIDEEIPVVLVVRETGSVKGSECYDSEGNAYFMSNRGFVKLPGYQELSYADVAIPFYESGSMSVTEVDGLKYLIFIGTSGLQNLLANAEWDADQTYPQNSGWAINLVTGAVSKYENYNYVNVNNGYASSGSGIAKFSSGQSGSGLVETRKLDFGTSRIKRISDAYILVDGGKTTLTVTTDGLAIPYQVRDTDILENVKVSLARGAKGRFWQFKMVNKTNNAAKIAEIEPIIIETPRR